MIQHKLTLITLVSMVTFNSKAMPIDSTDYSYHENVVKRVQAIIRGPYQATSHQ